jgi:FkbM family methyltransferase
LLVVTSSRGGSLAFMSILRRLNRTAQSLARSCGFAVRRRSTCIGEMEPFLERLKRLGFHPANILDVGANKTLWSRSAREVFPQAGFLLIEPQVEMLPNLQAFCAGAANCRWELAAAGPVAGELVLNVWHDHLAGSSLLAVADADAVCERRSVPIVTIDSLYPSPQSLPDLVKLDVQGFELEALKGATTLFGKTDCFVMEVGLYATVPDRPLVSDVIAFMNERNYKVFDIPGFLRRPLDGALGEIDLAFVLKGGRLDRHQNWC